MKPTKGYVDNSLVFGRPSNGQAYNRLVFERPKILLIAPHKNIVEPFKTALEKHGFAVTVADSSPSQSRSPHTEQFALVVNLGQNGRLGAAEGQADGADVDKFVNTVIERLLEQTASWHGDQQRATSNQRRASSIKHPASNRSAAEIPTRRDNLPSSAKVRRLKASVN